LPTIPSELHPLSKEMTMTKTCLLGATVLLVFGASAALAASGEYQNLDPTALANGKGWRTTCDINAQIDGRTYCFATEDTKGEFMKDPVSMRAKADAFYASKANDPNWTPCDYNDDWQNGSCE
jgi:YHS domain-containing protein